jgi:hypothetical protein
MGEVIIKVKDEKGAEIEQKLDDAAVGKLVTEHSDFKGKLAAAEGKAAKMKVVEEFGAKYGLDPETLVANADGAFTLMGKLIEDGIIDASGKVLVKKGGKEGDVPPKDPAPGDLDLDALLKGDTKGLTGEAKTAAMVLKALEPVLKGLGKSMEDVTTVQTGMIRGQWEEKLMKAYPNLSKDDVKKVFSEAVAQPKKGLMDIAKGVSESKSTAEGELRKKYAKEWGVNLEQVDANKLDEKGPEVGAGAMFQGKTFTLSKRRVNKDRIDPVKATKEYLRKQGILR